MGGGETLAEHHPKPRLAEVIGRLHLPKLLHLREQRLIGDGMNAAFQTGGERLILRGIRSRHAHDLWPLFVEQFIKVRIHRHAVFCFHPGANRRFVFRNADERDRRILLRGPHKLADVSVPHAHYCCAHCC